MSGKKILALAVAIIVGVVVFKILTAIITFALGWIIPLAVGAVVVYALYRGFNYMLDNGKRLT